MEKLNKLITKAMKIVIWNRIGLILFILGIISFGITIVFTATTKHPYYILSILLMIPMFIIAGIFDRTVSRILDEILKIFKNRLRWGINNDDIFFALRSHITESDVGKYTVIVECRKEHLNDIMVILKEIVNSLNSELPPRFHLDISVTTKL